MGLKNSVCGPVVGPHCFRNLEVVWMKCVLQHKDMKFAYVQDFLLDADSEIYLEMVVYLL